MPEPGNNHGDVTRRPATEGDAAFLRRVYASSRAEELAPVPWDEARKAAFLDSQFDAQHTFYHAQWPDAEYDVLMRGGTPIGRIYIDRRDGAIHLMDIALLPDYRNAGIGTALIRTLMDEAAAQGQSLQLYVETFNRAGRLYARLGFVPVQNDGVYVLMEWKPSPCTH